MQNNFFTVVNMPWQQVLDVIGIAPMQQNNPQDNPPPIEMMPIQDNDPFEIVQNEEPQPQQQQPIDQNDHIEQPEVEFAINLPVILPSMFLIFIKVSSSFMIASKIVPLLKTFFCLIQGVGNFLKK